MILIQNLLSTFKIQIVCGIFTPWQTDECLQIIQQHIKLRALRIQVVEFVCFLIKRLADVHRPFLAFCLLHQFIFLRRRFVTHLCLHILDLLLQEVVTLLLINILTGLIADICLQVLEIDLTIDDFHHVEETLLHRLHLQQSDFLFHRERHV